MDSTSKIELESDRTAKRLHILERMAKMRNLGGLQDLSATDFARMDELTDKYLEEWLEADSEGHPIARLDGELNTLIREYYEIKKQLDEAGS
jgi:hypothetical protein